MAYKLKLPAGSCIHPVFYVSLLKKQVGKNLTASTEAPPTTEDGILAMEPEAILDTHRVKKGSKFVEESLIKWKRLPKEDATWENAQEVQDRFLNINPKDKIYS